jgi:prepilin-type N-terminal cleavage/methylation domain-containing protein
LSVRDSRGFTLLELVIVAAIIAIIMSIAMPMYIHSRLRANETSAVASLQAINQSQHVFAQTCGRQRYAPSLPSLAKANPGTSEAYLSPDLTSAKEVVKNGYVFSMGGTEVTDPVQTCTGETPVESYQATADPTTPGTTGIKFFGTNTTIVVYESLETLKEKMPETEAPKIGQELKGVAR